MTSWTKNVPEEGLRDHGWTEIWTASMDTRAAKIMLGKRNGIDILAVCVAGDDRRPLFQGDIMGLPPNEGAWYGQEKHLHDLRDNYGNLPIYVRGIVDWLMTGIDAGTVKDCTGELFVNTEVRCP